MKFFRIGMAIIVVFLLVAGGIYFFADNERIVAAAPQLSEFKATVTSWFEEQEVDEQVSVLSERSQEAFSQTQKVLGESITANPEKQPLHEKALEYGQYIYCKQVVDQYESQENFKSENIEKK